MIGIRDVRGCRAAAVVTINVFYSACDVSVDTKGLLRALGPHLSGEVVPTEGTGP